MLTRSGRRLRAVSCLRLVPPLVLFASRCHLHRAGLVVCDKQATSTLFRNVHIVNPFDETLIIVKTRPTDQNDAGAE